MTSDLPQSGLAGSSDSKSFFRRHRGSIAFFGAAAVLALAWAVYVFLWFVGNSQSTALVPGTLGLWTTANVVAFILYAVFWELLLVGVPVAVAAVAAWQWWKRLPEAERAGYRIGKRSRSASGGGGVSLLFLVAFCIKVFIDGRWNVAIAAFTLDYVVGSMVTILLWILAIVGIPVVVGFAWRLGRKKP